MTKHYLVISMCCFALAIAGGVMILNNCSGVSIMQQDAFDQNQKAFTTYPSIECNEEITITLDSVKVNILCRDSMKKPTAGRADTNNEIWVIGRKMNDKVVLNQFILGHELQHLLNWKDGRIANPDG